jgi:hypothetical protein
VQGSLLQIVQEINGNDEFQFSGTTGKISPLEATAILEEMLKKGLLLPGGEFPSPAKFLQFAASFQASGVAPSLQKS